MKIARWLSGHDRIKSVCYVGLNSHPGYEISLKQTSGFGGMITFRTDSEQTAIRILNHVAIIQYAESLGGAESLITYPMLQTHADLPKAEREARGIDNCLLRLSVGLECADDLIADLKQALEEN